MKDTFMHRGGAVFISLIDTGCSLLHQMLKGVQVTSVSSHMGWTPQSWNNHELSGDLSDEDGYFILLSKQTIFEINYEPPLSSTRSFPQLADSFRALSMTSTAAILLNLRDRSLAVSPWLFLICITWDEHELLESKYFKQVTWPSAAARCTRKQALALLNHWLICWEKLCVKSTHQLTADVKYADYLVCSHGDPPSEFSLPIWVEFECSSVSRGRQHGVLASTHSCPLCQHSKI